MHFGNGLLLPNITMLLFFCVADTIGLWQFSFVLRFDRDWKKIEDFIGSKTVIQVGDQLLWIFLFCFI